jgi:hypothetical protein
MERGEDARHHEHRGQHRHDGHDDPAPKRRAPGAAGRDGPLGGGLEVVAETVEIWVQRCHAYSPIMPVAPVMCQ